MSSYDLLGHRGHGYQNVGIHGGAAHLGNVYNLGRDDLFSRLPYAADAPFNTFAKQHEPACLPDTRVDLLHETYSWADEVDEQCIFWLSGHAGTGKSTIARTVARRYNDRRRLAASFFFSRGGGDTGHAGRFVTSIAVQLAHSVPAVRQHISDAVAERSDIVSQSLRDQWQHLVLRPLSKLREPESYIIVVDALDECDSDSNIRIIVQLLAEVRSSLTGVRLRMFLTSRSELAIRYGFRQVDDIEHKDVALHDILPSIVNLDIERFLKHHLGRVAQERSLATDWPGAAVIAQLVQSASGLFIWAATACRFIRDGKRFATKRLTAILHSDSATLGSPEKHMDQIYLTVLKNSLSANFTDEEREDHCSMLRQVLGSVVVLLSPLSALCLSTLLHIAEEDVSQALEDLHAILSIPQDPTQPLRLHHYSFREFLLSKEKCGDDRFWVDERNTHKKLASCCLRLMSSPDGLRQDICSTQDPGALVDSMSKDRLEEYLPSSLQYTCLYWVEHLHKSSVQPNDNDSVHVFLKQHFLHWLEALSWVKKVPVGIRSIISLELITRTGACPDLCGLVHDMKRFAMYGQAAFIQAPSQVYCSALVFAPAKSIVKKQFGGQMPRWLKRLPAVEDDWNALLQTLEGHVSSVTAVVFARDGETLASASQDSTVRIWDANTGAIMHKMEGHSDHIKAIEFSPDGRLIASASKDATVKLWHAATGTLDRTFEEHSACVNGVVFSPNGNLIVSASNDHVVGLWDMSCIGIHYKLCGHTNKVNAVAFSPCGRMIASASDDRTLRLWDPVEGTCLRRLAGHIGRIRDVKFSLDSSRVASASYDNTIRLWDPTTGANLPLEGHSGWVNTIDFSPDGSLLMSASDDCTIRLWSVVTGKEQQKIDSHSTRVRVAAYSPSGNLIVAASCDASIELWNPATRTILQPLTGHSALVNAFAISPDGRSIVSASDDGTVKMWDINMHATMQRSKHEPLPVNVVGFSPDGSSFAFKSSDGTVTQYDSLSGSQQQTSAGQLGNDQFLAFSQKGFISQSPTGVISQWHSAREVCTTAKPDAAMSIDGDWVCQGGQKLLWLPQAYRPTRVATSENAILLAHKFRSPTYLKIDISYGF